MNYDENNLFDNCRFVADVMKTRQDLRFQALRLIHYVIYRVICDDEDLQTFTGSVTELAEAFHIQRSNIYRDIDSLSAQLHSTGMILGHKDPRKSWRTVTWLSRSCYNGRGTILIKLSYSMVSYVKGIRHMFSDDFEIISADRFFHKDADPEYEIADLRYWLDCEKKYLKTNDFCKYVVEAAVREINCCSDSAVTPVFVKNGRSVTKVRFEIS